MQQDDRNLSIEEMAERVFEMVRKDKDLYVFARFVTARFSITRRSQYFLLKHLTEADVSPSALYRVQEFLGEYTDEHPGEKRFTIPKMVGLAKSADKIVHEMREKITPPPKRKPRVRL